MTKSRRFGRIMLTAAVVSAIACFFLLDLGRYFDLGYLQENRARIVAYYTENPLNSVIAYSGVYVIMAALSLPGAALLTLLGGAIFGTVVGSILVSLASTLGATSAFLLSRYLLRDLVARRLGSHLAAVNRGIAKDGAFYLFSMRLIPAIPFFAINLVMGLTAIRTATFFAVSQLGMLPGTIVYVNAGTELAKIASLRDLANPSLIAAFAALGLFPLVAKKLIAYWKRRKH